MIFSFLQPGALYDLDPLSLPVFYYGFTIRDVLSPVKWDIIILYEDNGVCTFSLKYALGKPAKFLVE